MMMHRLLPLFALLVAAAIVSPARAQTVDCASPSGIGSHACTFPEGQVVVETSLIDRTIDNSGGLRTASVLLGDTLVHVGVTHTLELQVGWDPYDHETSTEFETGETTISKGIGDVTVGAKLALVSAYDHPFGIAIQPSLVIPVGDLSLGAGKLRGGILLPVSYDLGSTLTFQFTPEASFIGDRDDDGRHLQFGATLGIDVAVARRLTVTAEYHLAKDDDPSFHRIEHLAALSASFMPTPRWQLNAGAAIGLTTDSPRLELLVGVARHFR